MGVVAQRISATLWRRETLGRGALVLNKVGFKAKINASGPPSYLSRVVKRVLVVADTISCLKPPPTLVRWERFRKTDARVGVNETQSNAAVVLGSAALACWKVLWPLVLVSWAPRARSLKCAETLTVCAHMSQHARQRGISEHYSSCSCLWTPGAHRSLARKYPSPSEITLLYSGLPVKKNQIKAYTWKNLHTLKCDRCGMCRVDQERVARG
eukprot:1192276-Prorocentrum_minimum.AAC.2